MSGKLNLGVYTRLSDIAVGTLKPEAGGCHWLIPQYTFQDIVNPYASVIRDLALGDMV